MDRSGNSRKTIASIKKINSKNIARDLSLMEIREIMKTRGERGETP